MVSRYIRNSIELEVRFQAGCEGCDLIMGWKHSSREMCFCQCFIVFLIAYFLLNVLLTVALNYNLFPHLFHGNILKKVSLWHAKLTLEPPCRDL